MRMRCYSGGRGPLVGWILLGVAVVLASATLAAAAPSRSRPSPRVTSLTPRVVSLSPRVINIAPSRPSPNQFSVNTDVLFAFDSYALSADAQAVLAAVVQQLKTAGAGTVLVVGYTDSIGDPDYDVTP